MKNLFCRELLTQHYQLLPINEMKKKLNKDCVNKQTLSGYPVYLFPTLKKIGKYCVRPDQLWFLKKQNPYTGEKLTKKDEKLWKDNTITLPITEEFNTKLCPLHKNFNSTYEEEYMFLVSPFPIKTIADLPNSIEITIRDIHYTLRNPILTYVIRPSFIYSMYYYIVRLDLTKKDKIIYQIPKNKIIKIYPLYEKETPKKLYDKLTNRKLIEELKSYFTYTIIEFSKETLDLLRELSIRLPEPIQVYRGIFIHDLKELKTAKLEKLTTGETITIDSRGRPVSWSTDSCISQYFATHSPARKMLGKISKIQFGIVYSTILTPRQIAIDTRLIERKYFKGILYPYDQQEVITFPYDKDGKNATFQCKIERLFLVDRIHDKVTIVHSFKNLLPLFIHN